MRTASDKKTSVSKLDIENLKEKLTKLYNQNEIIHVSVKMGRLKFEEVPSKITGIYNHFICVTANVKKYIDESFTINFIDIMIGKFKIKELEELREE